VINGELFEALVIMALITSMTSGSWISFFMKKDAKSE